ncbi:MAG: type II secretion system protein [Thermosipho sp. (in: Bacteria)]|nr:type II secretion system protein [Thermosipho sp. (in: thermotogales)]
MKKGFTLIELLIVMAIISALLGIAAPVGLNAVTKAKAVQVAANVKTLSNAVIQAFLVYDTNYFSAIDNNENINEETKSKLRIQKLFKDRFIDADISNKGYEIRFSDGLYKVYYIGNDVQYFVVLSVYSGMKLDNHGMYVEVPKS